MGSRLTHVVQEHLVPHGSTQKELRKHVKTVVQSHA